MPSKRQLSSHSSSTKSESSDSVSQWIFLAKDVFEQNADEENNPVLCKLKHPKTEQGTYFLFSHGDQYVYEVNSFKEKYRSWFIGETVQNDGSLLITTEVDPTFFVLPYLVAAEKTGKYMTLDQIITDDSYPDSHRLTGCAGLSDLHYVTDMKGSDDLKAYKYNKEKTLSWLKTKTERLSEEMSEIGVSLSCSHSAIYVKSKRTNSVSKDDNLSHAHGIVSEYLTNEMSTSLREYLGLPAPTEKPKEEPPLKKPKVEGSNGPIEDYSQTNDQKSKMSKTKQTVAQKKLSKVDTSGMKSLSSFFSSKSKS